IVAAAGVVAINSTTMMLALMLALAVGIDYSLFIVSRHRDQLATGMDAEESAARATATAGSAVVFAGATVVIALVGLGVAGIPFLTTMGIFAALSVAIEVALALTLLPAMMAFAGESLRPKPATRRRAVQNGFGPSRWWVRVVTRAPVVTIAVVVALLGAATLPAQYLQLALPNSGQNHPEAPDRITFDVISERFGVGYNGPLVITGSIVESTDPLRIVDAIRDDVEQVPGVKMVAMAVPNPNADTALIQVIPETGPDDPATTELVHALRALAPTWERELGVSMAVTGYTAIAIDVSTQLANALLPFGIFVVGLSLVLLAIVFRSIWVPVKAALGYLLSVGAAFGLIALVFNLGIGREFVNLHEPLPVISFLPIILMGILFGLAMDYEVFLTSRMREEFVHGNHTNPTEEGFVHSAKVVVAAAVIMIAVFAFFIPEGVGVIKPIAFGLAAGVAVDAFLVRMTLGPAVMKLLHGRAWWLPRWLARRMPHMDAEGEALTHQLALTDWPHPGADQRIYGEGLAAATDDITLFDGLALDLPPGRTLVLQGPGASRRALTLALTGRLALTSGELKVLGLVLPQQAGELRRRATFVDGAAPDAVATLAGPAGELVAVDDADRLPAEARRHLSRLASDPDVTLVLAGSDADALGRLVPDETRADLDRPAPTPAGREAALIGGVS
ncbi:MAG: MMPL family transporter, partial [Actinomycetes bacterium]